MGGGEREITDIVRVGVRVRVRVRDVGGDITIITGIPLFRRDFL